MAQESEMKVWWNGLSVAEKDAINHSLFYKQIFDLEKAYETFKQFIK